jgi:DNA-binding beta-propeller fold protein YncE
MRMIVLPSLWRPFAAASLLAMALAGPASAQLAVSANDGKVRLVDGVVQTLGDGKDTVAVIDLGAKTPKLLAEIDIPASVAGPPSSVAITPNGTLALVTAAEKVDPADKTKRTPHNVVTVLDLSPLKQGIGRRIGNLVTGKQDAAPTPPKVLATLQVGNGAAGVAINKAGTLALVANRAEGTVSVLTIQGNDVKVTGKVDLGDPKSGPSGIVILADGKTAYVTLDGDAANRIAILSIDGTTVTDTKRSMFAGLRPYGIDVSSKGDYAAVANIGRGNGDSDTISVIDLKLNPPRVVSTATVGQTPEGIAISPDGTFIAVSVMNGTNKAKASPYHREQGLLQIWRRGDGGSLNKVSEAPVGRWCQGIAWAKNSKSLMVQCVAESELITFSFSGIGSRTLTRTGSIKLKAGPSGIAVARN